MPSGARGGDEDVGEILADAVAVRRRPARRWSRPRSPRCRSACARGAGRSSRCSRSSGVPPAAVDRRAASVGERRARLRSAASARRKTCGGRSSGRPWTTPARSSVSTRPGDRDRRGCVDRLVDVEHVGDVAVAVAALAQPGVAIDVDPPVEHGLAGEARRRHAQQLDHAAAPARHRCRWCDVVDRELHQANRNWLAIAWSSAALSRMIGAAAIRAARAGTTVSMSSSSSRVEPLAGEPVGLALAAGAAAEVGEQVDRLLGRGRRASAAARGGRSAGRRPARA